MSFQQSYLSYVAEVTPGTTPGTPAMKKLRTTNPLAISPSKALLASEEVISHRQREHVRHGLKSVGGSIPTELSFAAFNDWLEALLSGVWSTADVDGVRTLKVGTTLKTFTVEQRIASDQFLHYLGVTPSQLSLTMNPTGIITANWDVVGMDFESDAVTLGAPADVATNPPFDGLGNAVLTEGGSTIANVTSTEMTINANKNVGAVLGKSGGDSPSDGQLQITGNLTARFASLALFQKFENETGSALVVKFTNPGGIETLEFKLPNLKYTGGTPQNNENKIDVACSFEALYDATESSAIVITEDV